MVRPLLRTEITQVVNRRAWYDATKLTTEVLSLYKVVFFMCLTILLIDQCLTTLTFYCCGWCQAPLHVEGWEEALREIGRLSYETVLQPQTAALMLNAVEELPVLVIAGTEDALVPLKSVQTLSSKLLNSVSSSLFTSLISFNLLSHHLISSICREWWLYLVVAIFHMRNVRRRCSQPYLHSLLSFYEHHNC